MSKVKKILVDSVFGSDIRAVLISGENNIEEIEYETENKSKIQGNIYLAEITRIEPSLQAAFINYGGDKSGFLPFSEIHPDYYVNDANGSDIDQNTDNNVQTQANVDEFENNVHQDLNEADELEAPFENNLTAVGNINIGVAESELETIRSSLNYSSQLHKKYKIQDVLKKGMPLLVQVQKEERGKKGATFTTYISIAGKYCVFMANKSSESGISKRISGFEERKRLKDIISEINDEQIFKESSIILRTAGINKSLGEIKRDHDYLQRLWKLIKEMAEVSKAPSFIYKEEDVIQKAVRDMYDSSVSEILVEGHEGYKTACEFMKNIMPTDVHKVKEYLSKVPLFTKFNIESQLTSLYQPIASLPSGGYIVINPTEALISIDVNSGKSISESNIEETALKTNLEAAKEIARQVKLRELSGLIVIDFIDMGDIKNRKIIEKSLKDFFRKDKARIQIGSISSFGLLEMSRQRLKPSFSEFNTVICNHCSGKGIVRADESNSMLILRTIENEVYKSEYNMVNVYTNQFSMLYLLNKKRKEIIQIEEKYKIQLCFLADPKATFDSFSIEKIKFSGDSANIKTVTALVSNRGLFEEVKEAKNYSLNNKGKRRIKWNENDTATKVSEKPTIETTVPELGLSNANLETEDLAVVISKDSSNVEELKVPYSRSRARRKYDKFKQKRLQGKHIEEPQIGLSTNEAIEHKSDIILPDSTPESLENNNSASLEQKNTQEQQVENNFKRRRRNYRNKPFDGQDKDEGVSKKRIAFRKKSETINNEIKALDSTESI